MIEHYYNEQDKILEVTVPEIITSDMISEHYKKVRLNKDLPRNLKIFIDARNKSFAFGIDDVDVIRESLSDALKTFDSIREVILVDEPYTTAISVMFSKYNKMFDNFSFLVFSTYEGARNSLLD